MVAAMGRHVKNFMSFQSSSQKIMDSLFSQINIKPMVFLCVGVALTFLGIFEIIGNGISIAIWVVVLMTGISAVNYGMREGDFKLPPEITAKFSSMFESGKDVDKS